MESLLEPVNLSPDTDRVLGEIRSGAENALYGAGSAESEELFGKHVGSLVEGAGLPVLQTMHYRWFLRELARLWRTRQGRDLAFHLELCIRKWVGLGLEPKTLQFLVCESYERLKGKDRTTKTPRHEENPGSDHSISRSLDPSIPSASTTKTPSQEGVRSEVRNQNAEGRSDEEPRTMNDGTFPGIMSGPRPPADPDGDSTTKTPSHQENPGSDTGTLDPLTPGPLPSDPSIPTEFP
jgi:hypothetical protein